MPGNLSRPDLILQIDRYLTKYPDEMTRLTPLLNQINRKSNPFDRKTLPGHITASGIVMENDKLLMIFHPFLKKWLQPGGHLESGETPLQAAKRETLEETGVCCKLHKWHGEHCTPIDIDIHSIPENFKKLEPAHSHYDFRYLLFTDSARPLIHKGDHKVSWKFLHEISEPNMRSLVEKMGYMGGVTKMIKGCASTTDEFIFEILSGFDREIDKLVVVTHIVPGTELFLSAVDNVFPIAAVIPKPNSIDPHVIDGIKKFIPILPYTRIKIKDDPKRFLCDLDEKIGEAKFAIIDTGGYFSHVLDELQIYFGSRLCGIVEDTENGHQKYERFLSSKNGAALFPCPVISVARSHLKSPEDFLVGQAIVFSAEALLREHGEILTGRRAMVLGYGKIGRSIAQNLHSKSVRVDVVDTNPNRLVLALAHGHHTGNTKRLLGDVDLIFCATGNRSLKRDDLAAIKRDAYVFTATSADDEIDDHLTLIKNGTSIGNGNIIQVEIDGSRFFLCNNGNAVNFVHGGVVGPFIKLVQAELVFAAAKLPYFKAVDRVHQLNDESKQFIYNSWLEHFS